ncbi:hypothetical protein [Secundilactobacillus mixtipabuli]|uniref:DUF2628 domain-containing protein n=1 Tax=Secundilactobacillus mixtipabuli TaxID=1435342 RepID=A0A1Z5I9K1_9LACO|nr:hypothetical protein [Secundilactobacillus mixtipabuli]GAW98255.1 hypothetical protein IWT30_00199 [Secundilactobacillus mixtipabuli]
MQNPFGNDDQGENDNNEGPNGLPLPPNYATVVKEDNGDLRIGKVGFSYTTFLFSFLVPIFRGDWYNFLCMIGVNLGIVLGLYSIHFTSIQTFSTVTSILQFALSFVWGYLYNLMYFRHLFNRGFKPATQRSKDLLEKSGYLPKEKAAK